MSPEQVRAEPVDARSDIFSLGTVLFEMLSKRRPFTGETTAELMTAILKEDPPDLAPLVKVPPRAWNESSGAAWRRAQRTASTRPMI